MGLLQSSQFTDEKRADWRLAYVWEIRRLEMTQRNGEVRWSRGGYGEVSTERLTLPRRCQCFSGRRRARKAKPKFWDKRNGRWGGPLPGAEMAGTGRLGQSKQSVRRLCTGRQRRGASTTGKDR